MYILVSSLFAIWFQGAFLLSNLYDFPWEQFLQFHFLITSTAVFIVVASANHSKGAFVWDQSGIRTIGVMRVSVCLGAILIPEYLDYHSGYSAPRSRIAGIYSGIYSYSGISQTNAP